MREGGKSSRASEARGSGAGEQQRGEFLIGVGRHGEGGESDRRGLIDRETRERWPAREGVNEKGKRISREDATDARAGLAGRVLSACGGRRGRWAGWARGQAGRGVGWAENKKKMISELKIGFLNLSRLSKFVEGDLGGILT
jgi:hypothetical protein